MATGGCPSSIVTFAGVNAAVLESSIAGSTRECNFIRDILVTRFDACEWQKYPYVAIIFVVFRIRDLRNLGFVFKSGLPECDCHFENWKKWKPKCGKIYAVACGNELAHWSRMCCLLHLWKAQQTSHCVPTTVMMRVEQSAGLGCLCCAHFSSIIYVVGVHRNHGNLALPTHNLATHCVGPGPSYYWLPVLCEASGWLLFVGSSVVAAAIDDK